MIRVGLIGLGGVAERIHLPAIRSVPFLVLAGACEPDPRRREDVSRRFGIRPVFDDAEALLKSERPDLVVIGSPPDSHRQLCLLAIEHGAHVLCEKPFVENVAEADEVIAAAMARQRRIAVNNQYRYMPIYRRTRERIASGDFGEPFLIQCWQQMLHPPSRERNWRAGLVRATLFEFGTHALDLICYLFGARPTAVTAHMPHPVPEIAADVVVVLTLAFPAERVATMVLNRISHAPERYFEMRVDCMRASLRLSLGGVARAGLDWSKALGRPTVRLSFVKGGEARVERGGRSTPFVRDRRPAFAPATATHLARFAETIQRGGPVDYDEVHHARELIRIITAAYDSAAHGGVTVPLNEPVPA